MLFILLGSGEEQPWAKGSTGVYSALNQEQVVSVQEVVKGDQSSQPKGDNSASMEIDDKLSPDNHHDGPPPAYNGI